jgi:S1-C subfamily serine protease
MAAILNLPTRGILVQRVADGSFSEQIGLQPGLVQATIGGETLLLGGDVIVEALGVALSEDKAMEKIRDKMERLASGGELTLMIIRKGKLMPLTMLLASR